MKLSIHLCAAAAALLLAPAAASAQLSTIGGTVATLRPGGIIKGVDAAWDPSYGVYLVLAGYGNVYGVFVNASGSPVSSVFVIADTSTGFANHPKAEYNGAGQFLVTWISGGPPNTVKGRLVSYPAGGNASAIQTFSDSSATSFMENRPAIAFSQDSQRFLVAWTTISPAWGVQGRFVNADGSPVGGVMQFENPGGARDPALAWNRATNEFGLVYTGWSSSGAFARFRRIRASDGVLSSRSTFGYAATTFATGIDVNGANQYVLAWANHPGLRTAVFDPYGTLLTSGSGTFVTGRLGFDLSLDLAHSTATGTLLAVSSDGQSYEIGAAEVNANGTPRGSAQIVTSGGATKAAGGSTYPQVAARTGTNQWHVVYSFQYSGATSQIVASPASGSDPAPSSPAPAPTPTPTPAPTPSGCSTPDPFTALGGGTCCNGGWLPPGLTCSAPSSTPSPSPTPTPPTPTPTQSTCSTPDPFGALGGGTCCNGGWLPPGMTCRTTSSTPAPAPSSSTGCTIPDPFINIPGMRGQCINGGWVPVIVG